MDMDFFGVGPLEILFIFLIAFIVFGPRRIYDISRTAGRKMRNLSRAASDLTAGMEKEMSGSSKQDEDGTSRQGKVEKGAPHE